MKKFIVGSICFTLMAICASNSYAGRKVSKGDSQIKSVSTEALYPVTTMITFEKDTERFGTWAKDPRDTTQGIKSEVVSPGVDGSAKCIKLVYDVDSPNEAYCGFYATLNADLRQFKKLVFWAKGDKAAGFTSTVKVELKNSMEVGAPYTDKITDKWTKIEIPFEEFPINDWSKMTQIVITFDSLVTQKTGVIYIDNIGFAK